MLLVVGRIGRAHGVHGEATIEVRTDLPDERFVIGAQLSTDPETNGPLTIDSARDHNGVLLLKFREVSDRTAIERIRDTLLLADVDMSEEATFEDEYHVQQLIGCEVVDLTGIRLGVLEDVVNLPGQDLLSISTPLGELLIPFIKEFVPDIDLDSRKIIVDPPSGLIDLNTPTGQAPTGEHDAL